MSDNNEDVTLSSYCTFSWKNVVISGLSNAGLAYAVYRGAVLPENALKAVVDVSLAVLCGSTIWHTLASRVLFAAVPRQTFSLVQSRLFPHYFTLLHVCSGAALTAWISLHGSGTQHVTLYCLLLSYVTSATHALVLGPTLTSLSSDVIELERAAGVGQGSGRLTEAEREKVRAHSPRYQRTYRLFGAMHGASMVWAFAGYAANMAAVISKA